MKNYSTIRLVCFDLGGVVVKICRTWQEACEVAGIEHRGDLGARVPANGEISQLMSLIQTGQINIQTYASRLSDSVKGLYSSDEIQRIHSAWLLGEYEGIDGLIDRLHSAGFDTACFSNTDHEHWSQMPNCPTVQMFRHKFPSHEIGVNKPTQAAYRKIEHLTGTTSSELLFFDDLRENVEAARNVGWHAEQIDHSHPTHHQIESHLKSYGLLAK